jgi:hypothetical protein
LPSNQHTPDLGIIEIGSYETRPLTKTPPFRVVTSHHNFEGRHEPTALIKLPEQPNKEAAENGSMSSRKKNGS